MSNAWGLFGMTSGRDFSLMARQVLFSRDWGLQRNMLAALHAPLPIPHSTVVFCLPFDDVAANKVRIAKIHVQEKRHGR